MTKRIALIAALTALAAPASAHAGFSGVVLFGSTALLDGTPSADTVRLFTYGGLVRNDLRARGDLNFASDSDFDSAAPGDQTLPDNPGSVIAVSGGDGNDALYADELSATVRLRGQRGNDDFAIGDNVLTPVVVDGGSGTDTLDYGVRTTPVTSAPGPDSVFAADLSGDEGVPTSASTAVGDVVAVLAPSGQLSVDMAVAGMGSLANGAHVHGPAAPGTTGPVAFDLQQPQTTAFDLMAGPFSPTAARSTRCATGSCTPTRTRGAPGGRGARPARPGRHRPREHGHGARDPDRGRRGQPDRRHRGRRRRAQRAARQRGRRHPDRRRRRRHHRRRHRRRHDLRRRGRRRHPGARRRGRPDRVRRRRRQRGGRRAGRGGGRLRGARHRAGARPPAPVADRRAAVGQHLPRGQAAHRAQGPGRLARRRQHAAEPRRRPPRSAPCCAIASRRRPR